MYFFHYYNQFQCTFSIIITSLSVLFPLLFATFINFLPVFKNYTISFKFQYQILLSIYKQFEGLSDSNYNLNLQFKGILSIALILPVLLFTLFRYFIHYYIKSVYGLWVLLQISEIFYGVFLLLRLAYWSEFWNSFFQFQVILVNNLKCKHFCQKLIKMPRGVQGK